MVNLQLSSLIRSTKNQHGIGSDSVGLAIALVAEVKFVGAGHRFFESNGENSFFLKREGCSIFGLSLQSLSIYNLFYFPFGGVEVPGFMGLGILMESSLEEFTFSFFGVSTFRASPSSF